MPETTNTQTAPDSAAAGDAGKAGAKAKGGKAELDAGAVAKLLGVEVTVLGKPNAKGKRPPVTRKAGAGDIMDFKVRGSTLTALTVDGKRYMVELA